MFIGRGYLRIGFFGIPKNPQSHQGMGIGNFSITEFDRKSFQNLLLLSCSLFSLEVSDAQLSEDKKYFQLLV